MAFEIICEYKARVEFEISVDAGGYNYLVIFGKHINGWFCCVPGRKWGCEMAEPTNVAYNMEKLQECGADPGEAEAIALAIKMRSEKGEPCSKVAKEIIKILEESKQTEVDLLTPDQNEAAVERINKYQELLKDI